MDITKLSDNQILEILRKVIDDAKISNVKKEILQARISHLLEIGQVEAFVSALLARTDKQESNNNDAYYAIMDAFSNYLEKHESAQAAMDTIKKVDDMVATNQITKEDFISYTELLSQNG